MFEGEKNVVLAFYPKAFTGGCTKQLCGYRDDISTFKDADTVVIAVSNDAQEDSSAFREEYEMPFPVAGDKNENVLNAFGIPRIEFNGREFAKRTIVVVDKKGVVRYTDMDYVIGQDEEPLYASLEKLEEETEGS
jgi:peroxiredoxin Q/BCP